MKSTYGAQQLGEIGASRIAPARELLRNTAGIGTGFKWTYPVWCNFKVTSEADCKTKMDAVEAALQLENQDLNFYMNDNATKTTNSVTSASTLSGVRCVRMKWDDSPGGQFQTWRGFEATFEWETLFTLTGSFLTDFSETITIDNPPSRFVVTEAVNGVTPIARTTVLYPKSTGVQFGYAVGLTAR